MTDKTEFSHERLNRIETDQALLKQNQTFLSERMVQIAKEHSEDLNELKNSQDKLEQTLNERLGDIAQIAKSAGKNFQHVKIISVIVLVVVLMSMFGLEQTIKVAGIG